jgi:MFS family permease
MPRALPVLCRDDTATADAVAMLETAVTIWREERSARRFLIAQAQAQLGAGAGYVALMVLAYARIGNAWAATAVMLADLLPAMLLAPLFGLLADRTSRRGCAIAADVVRVVAFAGLVFAHDTTAMLALALLAGAGTALFRPATFALVPGLVAPERLAAVNGLYGAVREGGMVLGPALAGVLLTVAAPAAVLAVNAATFAVSALLLCGVRLRPVAAAPAEEEADAVSLRTVLADRSVRAVIATSGIVAFAAATMNVAELVLANRDLGAGSTGYALLTAAYGLGVVAGSLAAGRGGDERRRHVAGIACLGAGMVATSLAPALAVALVTFAVTGWGNGLFIVSNRLLLQRGVAERFHARAYSVLNAGDSWAFAGAVLAGGALATALGGRAVFALAGAALLVMFAAYAVRRAPAPAPQLVTA